MNTLANILNLLAAAAGYTNAVVKQKAKVVFVTLGAVVLALAITFVIAALTKWEALLIVVFVVSSLFFILFAYFATQIGPAVIDFIADFVPGKKIKSGIEGISKEIRKLFFPLCTISLICAFGAVHVSIRGSGMIFGVSLWVVFFIAFFFYIHSVYENKNSKMTGAILSFLVIVMVFTIYVNHGTGIYASKFRSKWNGHIVKTKEGIAEDNDRNAMNHGRTIKKIYNYWEFKDGSITHGHFTTPVIRNTPLLMASAEVGQKVQKLSGSYEALREVVFQDSTGLYSNQSLKCYVVSRKIDYTGIELGANGSSTEEGELSYNILGWVTRKGLTTKKIYFSENVDTVPVPIPENLIGKKYKISGHITGQVWHYNDLTGKETEVRNGAYFNDLPGTLYFRGQAGTSTTLIVEI